jgi:two-component system, NarL family, nitrate/nitrite response regulator NarL
MAILLSSANEGVIKRWKDLLSPSPMEQALTLVEVRRRCAARSFDLILLHRSLVDIPSFEELRKAAPSGRFFLLSDQPNEQEGLTFLKAGIAGYGNTYISQGRLSEAVRIIAGGGVWLGQQVIQQLILEMAARAKEQQTVPEAAQKLVGLTKMERKVAELVALGQTNLEIAANLDISERTVKSHLTSIYGKTKTGNRLSLALLINQGNSIVQLQ